MRTTLDLDDQVLQEARRVALATGRTLTAFIEEALRETLARRLQPAGPTRLRLPTLKGSRLRPGIDLDDSAALAELLERSDAAR